MYYTKREYNSMKNALTNENKRLKKEIDKLKKKIKELEYTKEVVFEPDFELNPVDVQPTDIMQEDVTTVAEQLKSFSKNKMIHVTRL